MNHASGWQLGEIPFNFTPLRDWRDNFSLPVKLPFSIELNPTTGTLVQQPDPQTEVALQQAYSLGSVFTGMMEKEGLGRNYANDFLKFVLASVPGEELAAARLVEIGCGTGYLLSELKPYCSEVTGIEPGEHSRAGAKTHDVNIIHDFFPSPQLSGNFHVVLSYCVLEHMTDPTAFLRSIATAMNPGAYLLLAVPDCEPYIRTGDISMFWHEHWNYFTGESLRRTLLAAGFSVRDIRAAGFGGTVYALAVKAGRSAGADDPGQETVPQLDTAQQEHMAFIDRASNAVERFGKFVATEQNGGGVVGFYAATRAINLLAASGSNLSSCRFFDDNEVLWNTYFPGIPVRHENRGEWASNPPAVTVIMSQTFGAKIRSELQALAPGARIVTWPDLGNG